MSQSDHMKLDKIILLIYIELDSNDSMRRYVLDMYNLHRYWAGTPSASSTVRPCQRPSMAWFNRWMNHFCAPRNNSRNVPRFWGSHPPNNCCHFPARRCQNLTHHQILPSCLCTQPCHWLESLGHYHMAKHLPFLFRLPLTILVSSITEGLKLRTKSCYFKDSTVTVWVRFRPASRRVTRLTCFLGWY